MKPVASNDDNALEFEMMSATVVKMLASLRRNWFELELEMLAVALESLI